MYVATFYSYKGGVGRTLALLNVAYEMADTGLKVLVVDFDLEAPAIHADRWKSRGTGITAATAASSDHAGMVEYVGTYLDTGQAPLVADYVVDATPDECAGEIGLMPAGRINDSYGDRLNQIDWNALYADHDGYLMFEDLRAQWETLGFHYVLVDSRTGFTDVGGICTRHLPDAVVTMFRPDDQSLRGISGVVQSIRHEKTTPRRKHAINLHFVMASIPAADDEDGILAEHRRAFAEHISIPRGHLLEVKQYQSMDLLTQPIYTRTRPRTSLARSYQALAKGIRALNVLDRDGVRDYLRHAGKRRRFPKDDDYLMRIRQEYDQDASVLGELAAAQYYRGFIIDAVDLLEAMAELRPLSTSHQMTLAEARHVTDDHEGAAKALKTFFQSSVDDSDSTDPETTYRLVLRGLNMLEGRGEDRASYVDGSPVIRRLSSPDQAAVARTLDLSPSEGRVAAAILESVLRDPELSSEEGERWKWALAFALMTTGRFADARVYLVEASEQPPSPSLVPSIFNLAMAIWADTGTPDREAFRRVLEAVEAEEDTSTWLNDNANALQALAVAAWFAGRRDEAHAHLKAAEDAIKSRKTMISCWSYTRVSRDEFRAHCDEIRTLLSGSDIEPVFMRRNAPPAP
ncbi:KGGVGR-motif variant AAA ATPase [Candidatus Palauibacter sp.]|uniref:KGGVGR-motif variant AAA ATPase n=1 Tax=Candidatus Palauibacter sp. TaxID=3101350 RepID=UPI003B522E43